jgi:hypothetical protein
MTVVCAWCGLVMAAGTGERSPMITHGVCEPCLDRVLAEEGGGEGEARPGPVEPASGTGG